jgi:hypothetical protein
MMSGEGMGLVWSGIPVDVYQGCAGGSWAGQWVFEWEVGITPGYFISGLKNSNRVEFSPIYT